MKKISTHLVAASLVSLLAISSQSAKALTETDSDTLNVTSTGALAATPQFTAISNSDLLENGSSYLTSVFVANAATPATPESASTSAVPTSNAGLNDGLSVNNSFGNTAYYGYNSNPGAKANLIVGNELGTGGTLITFDLNTVLNPLGYNINTLNTVAGWVDHASVANQDYTLSYSTVAAPTVFIPLTSVAYNISDPNTENTVNGGDGATTEVSLTGLGLTGVAALQFDFTAQTNPALADYSAGTGQTGTGVWIQEIDGFGTPTAAPEPSTWAMMVLGGAGIVVLSLRRLARA